MKIQKVLSILVATLSLLCITEFAQTQTNTQSGEQNIRAQCKQTCNNIVFQESSVLKDQKFAEGTFYCSRNDPSEGRQDQYPSSDSEAQALERQGYVCFKGLPTQGTYLLDCYNSCLQKLRKSSN